MKNKNLLLILSLFFTSLFVLGQAPEKIDFQAMARDGSGNPLLVQTIGVRISVIQGATTVYTERHTPQTDDYGLFMLHIGDGTPLSGNFSSIDWSLGNHKVKVEVDPNGGYVYLNMGTSVLTSTPYAFYGEDADADPGNEFQTLSVVGNDLTISDGNTVTLPGGGSSLWQQNGSDIYYDAGFVGIGTDTPDGSLHVPFSVGNTTAAFGTNISTWHSGTNLSVGNPSDDAFMYFGQDDAHKGFIAWEYDSSPTDGYFGVGAYAGSNALILQPVANNTGVGVNPLVKFHVEESGSGGVSGSDLGLVQYPGSNHASSIYGRSLNSTASYSYGVLGSSSSSSSFLSAGVYGEAEQSSSISIGVWGYASGNNANSVGVYGSDGGSATNNYAGFFYGDVHVSGNLSKGGGSFKIDHPQDPANKYLIHSFVESPDMMNVYNGNVVTGAEGMATVELPSYFEAENIDFKYQLTVIGQFAQAIIKTEISNNSFTIQTDIPNVKVSWQVTGVRDDAWANAHRIVPEVEKEGEEKGRYMHPELFGKSKDMGLPINIAEKAGTNHKAKTQVKKLQPNEAMGIK